MSNNLAEHYASQPGIPANTVAALAAANEGQPLAELAGDVEPIISRLETGESARQIATSLGITHVALYAWLLRHCPDRWQEISAARQLSRLDNCEQDMDSVDPSTHDEYTSEIARADSITITRARETARMAQWHLERANRKLFGQDKGISIAINTITSIERVILSEDKAGVTVDAVPASSEPVSD